MIQTDESLEGLVAEVVIELLLQSVFIRLWDKGIYLSLC